MRLADIADIHIDPRHILENVWAHNTAHAFVEAKRRALKSLPDPRRGE
jgi:hypothetical protein